MIKITNRDIFSIGKLIMPEKLESNGFDDTSQFHEHFIKN